MTSTSRFCSGRLAGIVRAFVVGCVLCFGALPVAHAEKDFSTPDAAMNAFGEAVTNNDEATLQSIFGRDFRNLIPPVGADIRFQFVRPATNTTLFSALVGPRIALHPKVFPLNPYAEFHFGPGHFSYGNNAPSTTQFDWRVIGGLDKTVLPHLDWRVIEVSYGQLNTYAGTLKPVTLSTGIVLRLH